MSNRKKMLLTTLKQATEPLSSKELSIRLEISERSIRNYIQEINHSIRPPIITAIGKKYIILPAQFEAVTGLLKTLGTTNEERGKYLIKQLLLEQQDPHTIFDLAEKLYISFSTARNVIAAANRSLQKYDLKIVSKRNDLIVQGSRQQKRKLYADMIHQEINGAFFSQARLTDFFEKSFVDQVALILAEYFQQKALSVDSLRKTNILIHFLIILSNPTQKKMPASNTPKDLQKIIKKHLNILIAEEEATVLTQIIAFNTQSEEHHQPLLPPALQAFQQEMLTRLNKIYAIQLSSQAFTEALLVHLQNLIQRIKLDSTVRNPLKKMIQQKTPLIFDIATTAAIFICEYFHWDVLPEDEIAFLALHIGIELNRQNSCDQRIATLLLLPKQEKITASKVSCTFADELQILPTANLLADSNYLPEAELLITCLPIKPPIPHQVAISPFFTAADKQLITAKIEQIKRQKNFRLLQKQFRRFFSKQFFFLLEEDALPKEQSPLIQFLSAKLAAKNYVAPVFARYVIEREQMASTAFRKIAVPHQFEVLPKHSIIAIVISKDGIKWGDKVVNLVILVCISNKDRQNFRKLYEVLLEVFSEDSFIEELKLIHSFEEFEYLLNTCMK